MSDNGTVLYIGGFELPDKNAAAQRVITIGKILRELNYKVVFVGTDKETNNTRITSNYNNYFGFDCYTEKYPNGTRQWVIHLTSSDQYIDIIKKINDVKIVVFYNFQSIAMKRIMDYCHKNSIKCISDVTEWYQPGGSIIHRILKGADTNYRMKILNKKCDGIIAISDYLYKYYKKTVNTVKIPPLIDLTDEKWKQFVNEEKKHTFVYAGKASDRKERLDLIVDAVEKLVNDGVSITVNVVGLTKEQYLTMYRKSECTSSVQFCGRVSHTDAVKAVSTAKWSIIARERTRVIEAGFPTKVVESITCGTPVCSNNFSNIEEYLDQYNSSICGDVNEIYTAMRSALEKKDISVDTTIFDYHRYLSKIMELI